MIDSLTSLRFVFALMIFVHHFEVDGVSSFWAGGPCGVTFFFILSGFVLSIGYYHKVMEEGFSYKDFVLKRLSKLWPLHVLCLFLIEGIAYKAMNFDRIARDTLNLFLLQSWFPSMSIYFSGNALSWYLSDMMFFYLIYPHLIKQYLVNF